MRKIYTSPSVNSGSKISYLFCVNDNWIAISESDKRNYYHTDPTLNDVQNFEYLTEVELYKKIPYLKGKLEEQEEKFIYIDYKNGQVYVNPKHKTKNIFNREQSARATNQTNFNPKLWVYLFRNKEILYKLIIFFSIVTLCSIFISWAFLISVPGFVFFKYLQISNDLDAYNIGTLNLSIVISENPTRIATLVDMSKGRGEFPLVKVSKKKIATKYSKVNTVFPSACTYVERFGIDYWDMVSVNPLIYVTDNRNIINNKLSQIPSQDVSVLKKWISKNNTDISEGYYPLRDKKNGWFNYIKPKFESVVKGEGE